MKSVTISKPSRDWFVIAIIGSAALSLAFIGGAFALGYVLKKRLFG